MTFVRTPEPIDAPYVLRLPDVLLSPERVGLRADFRLRLDHAEPRVEADDRTRVVDRTNPFSDLADYRTNPLFGLADCRANPLSGLADCRTNPPRQADSSGTGSGQADPQGWGCSATPVFDWTKGVGSGVRRGRTSFRTLRGAGGMWWVKSGRLRARTNPLGSGGGGTNEPIAVGPGARTNPPAVQVRQSPWPGWLSNASIPGRTRATPRRGGVVDGGSPVSLGWIGPGGPERDRPVIRDLKQVSAWPRC